MHIRSDEPEKLCGDWCRGFFPSPTPHCGRLGNRFNFSSRMPTVHSLFLFSSGLPGRCQGGTPDYITNTFFYDLQLTTDHTAYHFGVPWVLITIRFVRLTVNIMAVVFFGGSYRGVIEDSCRLACGSRRFVYTVKRRNVWRHTPRDKGSRHRRLNSLVTFLYQPE
jgi:hypothetical protein